ncbi:hypothetical protein ACP4OV_002227 [Aristida adscensionis]
MQASGRSGLVTSDICVEAKNFQRDKEVDDEEQVSALRFEACKVTRLCHPSALEK